MTNENIKPDSFATDCERADNESGTVLLPCPFCGGEAKLVKLGSAWWVDVNHRYECPVSDVYRTGGWYDRAEAITAWNTRVERTCKAVYAGHEIYLRSGAVCSECGKMLVDHDRYCSTCGAKVVGDDE